MEKRNIFPSILGASVPVIIVAVFGSLLTDTDSSWYLGLEQPSFNPDKWVFPFVWSVVYLSIILSLYLYFRANAPLTSPLVTCLVLAGICDILWSLTFFTLHQLLLPCFILVFLLALLLYCGIALGSRKPICGVLFLPHILWGVFALILNIAFFVLNL